MIFYFITPRFLRVLSKWRGKNPDTIRGTRISLILFSVVFMREEREDTRWHELQHHVDEHTIGFFNYRRQYKQETADKGYWMNRFEIRARYAGENRELMPKLEK